MPGYKSWPGSFVPAFHFHHGKDSVVSPFPAVPAPSSSPPTPRLGARIGEIAQRTALLHDQYEIENLQKIFGFYIDKGQWDQAADLFSEGSRLDVAGSGAFMGQKRIREYLHAIGPAGPAEGRLFDNMQLQPIVTVLPDRQRAMRRLNRMFGAISATNEAILRAKTEEELYERVCSAAVNSGKSAATVVLLAQPGSIWLEPVAGTGDIVEQIKQARHSIDHQGQRV